MQLVRLRFFMVVAGAWAAPDEVGTPEAMAGDAPNAVNNANARLLGKMALYFPPYKKNALPKRLPAV